MEIQANRWKSNEINGNPMKIHRNPSEFLDFRFREKCPGIGLALGRQVGVRATFPKSNEIDGNPIKTYRNPGKFLDFRFRKSSNFTPENLDA